MPCPPRLNYNNRILHRFYEPLVLLKTLNPSTRGNGVRQSGAIDTIDTQDRRSKFLDQLSWLCDSDKGGLTVSAIAAEQGQSGPIYWHAAPGTPRDTTRRHLLLILDRLKTAHDATEEEREDLVAEITAQCVGFSRKKVRNYRQRLAGCIAECKKLSPPTRSHSDAKLLADLDPFTESGRVDVDQCWMAYSFRNLKSFDRLSEKYNFANGISLWSETRHYIGRLGSWSRAAKILVEIAAAQPSLVDDCTVEQLGLPRPIRAPEADSKTTLESALRRMLPAGSSDLTTILATLQSMRVFDVASGFLSAYTDEKFKPAVHAETALLEHFHQKKMKFVENHKYIGCSKPSCYCCSLYVRHHPGHFIQRPSHGNVYTNWRAPLSPCSGDSEKMGEHTRDILNLMISDIRSEVMFLIETKASRQTKVPDSTTGISASLLGFAQLSHAQGLQPPTVPPTYKGNGLDMKLKTSEDDNKDADNEDDGEEVILFRGRTKVQGISGHVH